MCVVLSNYKKGRRSIVLKHGECERDKLGGSDTGRGRPVESWLGLGPGRSARPRSLLCRRRNGPGLKDRPMIKDKTD